ncbi:MAG TPA: inositol monophosphatase family protein [Longimicrobiales bacterium]|nr:inositol monophosphatase family protein [Longimicrobiales bacterium]
MSDAAEYKQALAVARRAARAAADVHQAHLGQVKAEDWSNKGIADFVTYVDREAEAEIVACIQQTYHDHHILAEESSDSVDSAPSPDSEWTWIVDPLDGTTNFLHQFPMYCASVGLLHRGEPAAAAVVCGSTGEEWTAARGAGAFRNGSRIAVSQTSDLGRALIGTGFPFKLPHLLTAYLRQFDHIIRQVSDLRRGGSAALDLCYVASGFLDGFWELDLRPWDYAAGVLMIQEAGGQVSGLSGPPIWSAGGGGLIAGNPHIYSQLVRMLSEVPA